LTSRTKLTLENIIDHAGTSYLFLLSNCRATALYPLLR